MDKAVGAKAGICFGFVNVDKPSGITSSTVVNRIKRLTGIPCGHMGTLDPLASGVLPVGVGNATRLFDYFLNKQKKYIAEFTFGVTSETLDSTVETVPCGRIPEREEIRAALPCFMGNIMQVPPLYSAKNVNGRRGYELARAGVEFTLAPKQVRVDEIILLSDEEQSYEDNTEENINKTQGNGVFRFRIRCGGGTYIRSLARDIAEKIGTKAVMSGLRRTQSGYFKIEDSVAFDSLNEENVAGAIIPTEKVLPFDKIGLCCPRAERIFHGIPVPAIGNCGKYPDGLYKIDQDGIFYGIAEVKEGLAKIATKLC